MPRMTNTATDHVTNGIMKDVPPPPAGVGVHGQDAWNRAAGYLVPARLLAGADLPLLERYAKLIDYAAELEADIDANGAVADGRINPSLRMLSTVSTTIKSVCLALHIAPYSRLALTKAAKTAGSDSATRSPLAAKLRG